MDILNHGTEIGNRRNLKTRMDSPFRSGIRKPAAGYPEKSNAAACTSRLYFPEAKAKGK